MEAGEALALLGAVVTAAGFIALVTAKRVVTEHEKESTTARAAQSATFGQVVNEVRAELHEINRKLDVDLERMNDAISVILIESGNANPDFEASVKRRTPHVWRYYAEHKRD